MHTVVPVLVTDLGHPPQQWKESPAWSTVSPSSVLRVAMVSVTLNEPLLMSTIVPFSAAGNEVSDALNHLAAVHVGGIMQTGGDTLVVAGSGIGVDGRAFHALGALDLVLSHGKTSFRRKFCGRSAPQTKFAS